MNLKIFKVKLLFFTFWLGDVALLADNFEVYVFCEAGTLFLGSYSIFSI